MIHTLRHFDQRRSVALVLSFTLIITLLGFTPAAKPARAAAGDVTIAVVDRHSGNTIPEFRFIVNEDIAHRAEDGRPPSQEGPESFSPVVAKGDQSSPNVNLPNGNYLVSVIGGPDAPAPGAYKMSGKHFSVAGNEQTVTVELIPEPLPTSSITVVVHHDNHMVNGAQDIPQEAGLEGFSILLEDGTGEVSVDFWGNPICTEYEPYDINTDYPNPPTPKPNTGGQCLTDENGEVTIPFLAAHKYGVFAIPPNGSGWIQTSTIEGTRVVDVWAEEGNSGLLTEGGVTGPLVALGFVQRCEFGLCPELDNQGNLVFPSTPTVPQGTSTITGTVREASEAGGEFNIVPGRPIDRPYIALNNLSGNDEQIYTGRGNADGSFSIPNVPDGTYQVVVWDEPQLYIISFETAVVSGGDVDMGDITIPSWFGHVQGFAYWDTGLTPSGEAIDVPGANAGPNGSVPGYANGFRDCAAGSGPFDYANCEPGIANQDFAIHFNDGTVKYGGVSDANGFYSFDTHFPYGHYLIWEVGFGKFRQMYTTGYFTEFDAAGNVVPTGYPYTPEQKSDVGGAALVQAEITLSGFYNWIDSGKLVYDPASAVDAERNGGISGVVRYAVTRNEFDPRIAAPEDYEPGVPNVEVNLYRAALGTDGSPVACDTSGVPSEGCPYGNGELKRVWDGTNDPGDAADEMYFGTLVDSVTSDSYYDDRPTDCTYVDLTTVPPGSQLDAGCREIPLNTRQIQNGVFDGGYAFDPLPDDHYIVEMVAPDNYRHIKEEDQNTDQGDDFVPAVEPADCAGPLHLVNDPRNPAHGTQTPLCDSKHVDLVRATNPAADFFLMVDFDDSLGGTDPGGPNSDFAGTTEVPPPGLMRGILFDDLTVQFDPTSVMFGGKRGVANTPVGLLDYEGNEIAVVYTDADGFFEVLLPSTYTRLCPTPGGVCAGMYLVVGNYPGQDPSNPITGWNPAYQTLTVTLDMWPGKTTYADVAILPITGFGFANAPACAPLGPDIGEVSTVVAARSATTPITISGSGFGATAGTVMIGGVSVPTTGWSDSSITVTDVPNGVPYGPDQLLVTTSGGVTGETGITIHVTGGSGTTAYNPTVRDVYPAAAPAHPIQDAIEAANQTSNGTPDLIVVHPGTYYESPVVWKRVKLQGFGPDVTKVDGRYFGFGDAPLFDPVGWEAFVASKNPSGPTEVPIGQVMTVIATGNGNTHVLNNQNAVPKNFTQIDGFAIIGGDSARAGNAAVGSQGGGIYAHADAHNLLVSNNLIQSNTGNAGGGVILGQPYVGDNDNDNVRIHHNRILNNGGTILAGGIGIFNGASAYQIDHNVICGNQSAEYGGGISHFGRSGRASGSGSPSTIADNRIVFNSAFDEGGGIMIAGELPLDPGGLTGGSGDVTITRNLIQHNLSNDDGGGIRLLMPESAQNGNGPNSTDRVTITNNMVVNNLAADIGGGIALDDAPDTRIINNTIVRNVSTATAEDSDSTSCNPPLNGTCPHGAGVTSTPHSAALAAAIGAGFSNPVMFNNIIWDNRAWFLNGTLGLNPLTEFGVIDLEVVGGSYSFTGSPSNLFTDPTFVDAISLQFSALPLLGAPNFIGVQIDAAPADNQGDYHLAGAIGGGLTTSGGVAAPTIDYDGQTRIAPYDRGADEVTP